MKHVVAISGGKDSVAMALRLQEVQPLEKFIYLITPVGNEPPAMFKHWDNLEHLLGAKLMRLAPFKGDGLVEVIRQQKMIPNFRARFCTRILKIQPTVQWLTENAPCVQYVGLRADEAERKGIYGDMQGVEQKYPMREWGWGIDEVWGYLDRRGVEIPERTDCAWCFFQRLIEWKRLWQQHPQIYQAAVDLEKEIGGTFTSPGRDTWPASLESLRDEFKKGRRVRGEQNYDQKKLFDCDREALCRVCSM